MVAAPPAAPCQITSHATPFKCRSSAAPLCRYGICSGMAAAEAGISFSLHCKWLRDLHTRRKMSANSAPVWRPPSRFVVAVWVTLKGDRRKGNRFMHRGSRRTIGRRRQVYGIPGSSKQQHHLLERFRQSHFTQRGSNRSCMLGKVVFKQYRVPISSKLV